MSPVLWHNPRCSKSRAALELLRERGLEPVIVDYLKTPPSAAEVEAVVRRLGAPVKTMMRSDEPEYAQLELGRDDVGDAELFAAMASHPRLIQRPILIIGERAVVGRPPEKLLELLS